MVAKFGEIFEDINPKTREMVLSDNLASERCIRYYSNNKKDYYEFFVMGLSNIPRDKRKNTITIKHYLEDVGLHQINLVKDFSHLDTSNSCHLNITEDSKKIVSVCKNCKKYFNFLDHFPIFPIQKNGIGLIDSDIIWERIRAMLPITTFLEDYERSETKRL